MLTVFLSQEDAALTILHAADEGHDDEDYDN